MGLSGGVRILRKEKAIGLISQPGLQLSREQLDEFALSAQRRLSNFQHINSIESAKNGIYDNILPFCAFNGGSDVWVDIGNKLIGVSILQAYFKANGSEVMHVGDQFLSTGNDIATRRVCTTVWITNPEETAEVLKELIDLF